MKSSITQCILNEAVECWPKERNCASCGWNPQVARERLEQICAERGIKLPEEENPDQ